MMIRDATVEDINGIYALEKLVFRHPWNRAHIAYELQNNAVSIVKVLVNDEAIYGYIFVLLIGTEMQILNLAVHPAERKKGWGRMLLESVLALSDQCRDIFLEVRPSNQAAFSLYRNAGFQPLDRRKAYYPDGEDAIIMRKLVKH